MPSARGLRRSAGISAARPGMHVALYQPGHEMTTTPLESGKPPDEPHAALERALIAEFLAPRGHTLHSLVALPENEQQALLLAATSYATLRLSEMEARARFVEEIEER